MAALTVGFSSSETGKEVLSNLYIRSESQKENEDETDKIRVGASQQTLNTCFILIKDSIRPTVWFSTFPFRSSYFYRMEARETSQFAQSTQLGICFADLVSSKRTGSATVQGNKICIQERTPFRLQRQLHRQ